MDTAPICQAKSRSGKLLVFLAVLLPVLLSIAGLVLDGGLLMLEGRRAQHAADAAATAAALDLGSVTGDPEATAREAVHDWNGLPGADVHVAIPPDTGPFAGRPGYVEVTVRQPYDSHFLSAAGIADSPTATSRAVAGREAATGPAAVVLLDPDPPEVTLAPLPLSLPSLLPLLGGLEVLGLGRLRVSGAIHVNNAWGGLDENGDPVGDGPSLRHACSCTPLLRLTHVLATDIRVVGGVDNPANYGSTQAGQPSPLRANRRPVADPYAALPAPMVAADPVHVVPTEYGGVSVVNLPLLQPPHVLRPGVYEWIQVVSGRVIFEPGVYIIRGVNPATQIGLSILTGTVQADGVMFYLTNTAGYSPVLGLPDDLDGEAPPPGPGVLTLLPSAVIDVGLLNSRFSPLSAPGSPFDGLLVYQRRQDRRPILIVQQGLLGNSSLSGNVYAKWAHVVLTAHGTHRCAFVCGSLRVLSVLETRIEPLDFLPPAEDVFLVE